VGSKGIAATDLRGTLRCYMCLLQLGLTESDSARSRPGRVAGVLQLLLIHVMCPSDEPPMSHNADIEIRLSHSGISAPAIIMA
jgi:hypothetical protein